MNIKSKQILKKYTDLLVDKDCNTLLRSYLKDYNFSSFTDDDKMEFINKNDANDKVYLDSNLATMELLKVKNNFIEEIIMDKKHNLTSLSFDYRTNGVLLTKETRMFDDEREITTLTSDKYAFLYYKFKQLIGLQIEDRDHLTNEEMEAIFRLLSGNVTDDYLSNNSQIESNFYVDTNDDVLGVFLDGKDITPSYFGMTGHKIVNRIYDAFYKIGPKDKEVDRLGYGVYEKMEYPAAFDTYLGESKVIEIPKSFK